MASLSYAVDGDAIVGVFARDGLEEASVSIECDGVYWATVPAERSAQVPGGWSFRCGLPPVAAAVVSRISARVTGGDRIGSCVIERQPLRNGLGLRACDVLATNHHPLMALPWLALNEGRLTVKGMHLPPEGDPAKLEIAFDPGVAYDVSYARHSPEFREHYWYWPNAERSGLRITIDLGASARDSNPFHFCLHYPRATYAGAGKRSIDVWIPRDLSAFLDYPVDVTEADRIGGASTAAVATVTAYNAFKSLEDLLSRAGITAATAPTLLHWGCGDGRIAGHFMNEWPGSRVFGCDADERKIVWCRERPGGERFGIAPLRPPFHFEEEAFDAVIGTSVMTRLSQDAQRAWLAELYRVMRPDGVALLTFQHDAYAAYVSRWRDANAWSLERRSQDASGFVALCATYFDVIWTEEAFLGGYQDCVVLRRL
jgi:SAM-dependent methyltransferase